MRSTLRIQRERSEIGAARFAFFCASGDGRMKSANVFRFFAADRVVENPRCGRKWRRGELNPCPRSYLRKLLHAYPAIGFKGPNFAPAHCRPPSVHEILHRPARSLRRTISLLSMFPAVAGVQLETSRSIKPRERDLGDLRLFFLVRILTRPTNHPRHAACASNYESKPVRPQVTAIIRQTAPTFKLCAGRTPP